MNTELLLTSIEEAQILGIFKNICDDYANFSARKSLRNIIAISPNKQNTIKHILMRKYASEVDDQQVDRLLELIQAFLRKSEYRKRISVDEREKLLIKQNFKCCFCGNHIGMSAHADHIVPFKYVGDELADNLQMLCEKCNEKYT